MLSHTALYVYIILDSKRRIAMLSPTGLGVGVLAALLSTDVFVRLWTAGGAPAAAAPSEPAAQTAPPLVPVTVQDPEPKGRKKKSAAKASKASRSETPRRSSRRLKSKSSWLASTVSSAFWWCYIAVAGCCGALCLKVYQLLSGLRQGAALTHAEVRIDQIILDGADSFGPEVEDRITLGQRSNIVARASRVAASRRDRVLAVGNKW